jgi:hypothetical protein
MVFPLFAPLHLGQFDEHIGRRRGGRKQHHGAACPDEPVHILAAWRRFEQPGDLVRGQCTARQYRQNANR